VFIDLGPTGSELI